MASTGWQPDVAETAWTERDGDKITIHNLRNFDYEPGQPAKPRWETKVVDLSQLRGVDLYINFWGSTLICHPILSFQFGPTDHVAISVETRMAPKAKPMALWNGKDPILKERLFGLTGPEGNHGEDVKQQYFYLDATPTYSYMNAL